MSRTDPALLVSATLTGPEAVEVLTAALAPAGLSVEAWFLDSVHHRVGRSLSALYSVHVRDADGQGHDVAIVAHADRKPVPEGPVTVTVDDTPVALWRFPQDPFLPGLPSATSPHRVRELLDTLDVPPGPVALEIRAYRPSRRAVVEVAVDGPASGRVLYLKVLAGDRAARLERVHRELADHLPIPGVVGVAPQQGILAIRALPGATLRSALVEGHPVPPAGALVALSERLSQAPLVSGADPTRFADPTRHVDVLGDLVVDRAAQVAEIAEAARGIGGAKVAVHGDLHDAQLLIVDGEIAGVLDVDGAGPGWLAQDAGSLVAHLESIAEVWPAAHDRVQGYADEVAHAYEQLVDPDDLARGAAGAWLGLATGPYRAQDRGWEGHTRRRIDRAAAWAARGTA